MNSGHILRRYIIMARAGVEYFSKERVLLMREVNAHPPLVRALLDLGVNINDPKNWGEIMAQIAAYVNVGMAGLYTEQELTPVYEDIRTKLITRRMKGYADVAAVGFEQYDNYQFRQRNGKSIIH